jgi:membrane protease YdiL (CAAX protease family)
MLDVLFKLLLFGLPTFAHVHLQHRQGRPRGEALAETGVRASGPMDYLFALGVLVVGAALGAGALLVIPPEILADRRVVTSLQGASSTGALAVLVTALSTLAEEVLFRGYLMMLLLRRSSPAITNAVQAVVFTAAHLVLLFIDVRLAPLLVAYLVFGFLLGLLRLRSGSIVPGWIAHMVLILAAVAAYAP